MLFLGDSITEEGGYVTLIEAAINSQHPRHPPKVINRGRGSETVSCLTEAGFPGPRPCVLDRLDKELNRFRPDWVIACYGMNCGLYQPWDAARFDAYRNGIETLISRTLATGARMILLTPPPFAGSVSTHDLSEPADHGPVQDAGLYGYRNPYPGYDRVLQRYADWLKSMSSMENVWVVDVRSAMQPALDEIYADGDPVHPGPEGHKIMADTFLKEWPDIFSESRNAESRP